MTEMFGEAWSPMSVPDLAPDDDDDDDHDQLIFLQFSSRNLDLDLESKWRRQNNVLGFYPICSISVLV